MSLDQKRTYAKLHMAKVYHIRRVNRTCADCGAVSQRFARCRRCRIKRNLWQGQRGGR